ncbi:MAG TPA: DUF86 domain-containing protein [Gammaproteobacteria bacterium]|nr:DUF86 domain-containing protein [Gammaproteobacteria bacterium]
MVDDVLLNKVASIERCLKRVADEYVGHENELETDYTRQDSIVLNLQRACEAAIDAAMHQVRIKGLGIPQESRDAFRMLEEAGLLSDELSAHMQAMVGFRNVAVHDYQKLNLAIVRAIINERLDDFRQFAKVMVSI